MLSRRRQRRSSTSSSSVRTSYASCSFSFSIRFGAGCGGEATAIHVNTTTATSPKATALDTKSGLPLAGNSDNSNSKSVDASNLTYDAELPPKAEPNVGVRCIDVSPDGRWLASGDRQGRIRVHDLQNMSEYSNMKSHDAEVLSISFCPKPPPKGLDGSGKIHEVDVANARPFTQPSLLASGGRDRLVKIYDASQKFNHWGLHGEAVRSARSARSGLSVSQIRLVR